MSARHISLSVLPSLCKQLSKLVETLWSRHNVWIPAEDHGSLARRSSRYGHQSGRNSSSHWVALARSLFRPSDRRAKELARELTELSNWMRPMRCVGRGGVRSFHWSQTTSCQSRAPTHQRLIDRLRCGDASWNWVIQDDVMCSPVTSEWRHLGTRCASRHGAVVVWMWMFCCV